MKLFMLRVLPMSVITVVFAVLVGGVIETYWSMRITLFTYHIHLDVILASVTSALYFWAWLRQTTREDAIFISAELNRADAMRKAMLDTAGAACHELNQPLQAISMRADLLSMCIETGKHEDLTRHADVLIEQVARAGSITYKMMNLKRYETKKHNSSGSEILDIEKSYLPKGVTT